MNPHDKAKKKEQSQANRLVKMAESVEKFHDANGNAFATVQIKGHRQTFKMRSLAFRRWLAEIFFRATKDVPNSEQMNAALNQLEGQALYNGEEIETHVRIAGHNGKVWLDLANDDWQAVEIDANRWRVVDDPPVKFLRPTGMRALPTPVPGGLVNELRQFVNVASDQEFMLLIAFLVGVLCPTGPYFVLHLIGEQGSAKSFLVRLIRLLIDPNMADVRCETKNVQDLMIAAKNGQVITLDNLSKLPAWLSDALCRLSTGGGYSTRVLYSDDDEMIFDAYRPVVIASIADVVDKPDLLDRLIRLTCPSISDDERLLERKILAAFEKAHPRILGSLLDGVVAALKNIGTFELPVVSRMADPAEWFCAACPAFGWDRNDFLEAYANNRVSTHDLAIEASLIGPVLIEFMEKIGGSWEGTATKLLEDLEKHAGYERDGDGPAKRKPKGWPGAPHVLTGHLRTLESDLRFVGLDIDFQREKTKARRKVIVIEAVAPNPVPGRLLDAPGGAEKPIQVASDASDASSAIPGYVGDVGGIMGAITADLARRFPDDPDLSGMLDQFCEWTDLFHDQDGHPLELAAQMAYQKVLADRQRGAA